MNNIEHSCSNTQLSARCLDEIESAGEILKVCREAKGLSLDDVSQELKILKRNLSLLEHDQAHKELTLLFAKGYLKNYAQFLGLDAKALEEKWQLLKQDETANTETLDSADTVNSAKDRDKTNNSLFSRLLKHSKKQPNHRAYSPNHRAYYGVIAVVAIMGGALWLNADPVLKPVAHPDQVTVETPKGITTELLADSIHAFSSKVNNIGDANASAQSAISAQTTSANDMTDAERADLVAQLRQDYSEFESDPEPLDTETQENRPLAAVVSYSADSLNQQDETILRAGETGISTMLTPESQSELSFFFSDDCWIKVVDGQNRIVYEAVAKQNDSLELEGTPPFKVTLGYAPAVQVSYNGEPVEINTRQGRNVARIVLGS